MTAPRVLPAFFSRAGENYWDGGRRDLDVGNTAVVAEHIRNHAAVDAHRIEAADPYSSAYDATVQRNVEEEQRDARPELAGDVPDVSAYDVLLLGCPIWNVQSPMIMRTFLEAIDVSTVTVHPFVTYAMSGMGSVERDYRRIRPSIRLGEGLAIRGEDALYSETDVAAWLERIGLRR